MDFGSISLMVAIVMGLSEVFKSLGLNPKFVPILNLILGILLGIFYISNGRFKEGIMNGIIVGLSASGFYSGTKNTIENFRH
ncbi:hypothetical protein HAHI6034_03175 [Hathewaya histolytica]|uniref:Holin n=1 Tax=Hathewaya histolytica TaxID=1498 RepID=A0A4U9R993_HATHI|nr:hypothetical protein [Hathewaya histolytica]VTQ85260.1 Uncharacterised protein [Hathewaya histolytica]